LDLSNIPDDFQSRRLIALLAVIAALAGGAVTIGGPAVITVNGAALAGNLGWLAIGAVAVAAGELAAIVSWIGALVNTVKLEDKTWFVVLLVLGVVSFGWVAMGAYVLAGPDSTERGGANRRIPVARAS
jgi:hypothetical protein